MSLQRTKSTIISWDGSNKFGTPLLLLLLFWNLGIVVLLCRDMSKMDWHTLRDHSFRISLVWVYTFCSIIKTCYGTSEFYKCGASSEFVSSSIPSWQILTVHDQPFRGARYLVFCLKVPLHSLLVWASSRGSGETARMGRLAWIFTARIGDKYQICLMQPKL